jgi:opacity protein-like surface antigen
MLLRFSPVILAAVVAFGLSAPVAAQQANAPVSGTYVLGGAGFNGIKDGGSGDMNAASLMGNALYDFTNSSPFTPYVGVGLGGARVWVDDGTIGGVSLNDGSTVVAYQGMAGVGYALDRNLTLDLGYRYFGTQDPRFSDAAGRRVESEYGDHSVLMSLRYQFGGPRR